MQGWLRWIAGAGVLVGVLVGALVVGRPVPPDPTPFVLPEESVDPEWLFDPQSAVGVDMPPISEWPIIWNEERQRLTAAYIAFHRGPERVTHIPEVDSVLDPKVIVLHWTGVNKATSTYWAFEQPSSGSRRLEDHQKVNLSAHFLVDRDGTIFRLLDERLVGRHTIGLNHVAIGIENVGDGRKWPLTEAQVDANIALVRWLVDAYPTIHTLIGHREYRLMEGTDLFEETDPRFRTIRDDPGESFMNAVRAGVADLNLQGPPADAVVAEIPGGMTAR